MATTNGSTAIRDKILASLARYRALRIGKFPCAFWRLSSRPGLTARENDPSAIYDKQVSIWTSDMEKQGYTLANDYDMALSVHSG
ncbi:hypothetical protein [Bathymodiolus platifrons methanotrophic gill symbiont]|uniref:hypothetical protein n=1 Tax=Bathymodiolus platifrons methanotrophic gill symbiont TaxID=113268 RepID=UPI001C8CF963|nr:hypothetical protein [Bathymodiolus platifrons methanotrophic gill symbiont]